MSRPKYNPADFHPSFNMKPLQFGEHVAEVLQRAGYEEYKHYLPGIAPELLVDEGRIVPVCELDIVETHLDEWNVAKGGLSAFSAAVEGMRTALERDEECKVTKVVRPTQSGTTTRLWGAMIQVYGPPHDYKVD